MFFSIYGTYFIAILASTIITPLIYKEIIDIVAQTHERAGAADALMTLFIYLFIAVIVYNVFYRLGDYALVSVQSKILKDLADEVFARISQHSFSFFSDHFSGALVAKAKRYVHSFEIIHELFTFSIFFGAIKIVSYLIVLYIFTPGIALLYLGWIVTYLFIIRYFIKKQVPYDLAEAESDSRVTAQFSDIVSNMPIVKAFARKKQERAIYEETTTQQERTRRSAWFYHNFQHLVIGILFAILELAIMYIIMRQWIAGQISPGTIVLVHAYIIGSFDVVWNFGRSIIKIQQSFASAQEMIDIFEQEPDIKDPVHTQAPSFTHGEILFDHISFAYTNGQYVFKDFSLTITSGEKVALVGHSGVGKTTLVMLLLRFVDVTSGRILIDGQNIAHVSQEALRQHISYVPQDPSLFHRSIRENIAYGKRDATEEEIISAAKKAQAHPFITSLPDGYDTIVGERGVKLSGGQRQRIAIARAMLKDAPIVILDEATSALDSVSEQHIQKAFESLMNNRTTIVIAHRLSTIQRMDRIVVLEDGAIVESGTHEELIKNDKSRYKKFWQSQAQQFINERA